MEPPSTPGQFDCPFVLRHLQPVLWLLWPCLFMSSFKGIITNAAHLKITHSESHANSISSLAHKAIAHLKITHSESHANSISSLAHKAIAHLKITHSESHANSISSLAHKAMIPKPRYIGLVCLL
jgi:hypothetical protein